MIVSSRHLSRKGGGAWRHQKDGGSLFLHLPLGQRRLHTQVLYLLTCDGILHVWTKVTWRDWCFSVGERSGGPRGKFSEGKLLVNHQHNYIIIAHHAYQANGLALPVPTCREEKGSKGCRSGLSLKWCTVLERGQGKGGVVSLPPLAYVLHPGPMDVRQGSVSQVHQKHVDL